MLLKIYPKNPNLKDIQKVVSSMQEGKLVIYPTDSAYAIGCDALNVRAVEHICRIKGINPQKANLSIICYDLSDASSYAKIDDKAFKLMKRNLPGPFTFILPTSSMLPKIYKNRKTVGIRIPDNEIVSEIIRLLGNPILTTTVPKKEEDDEYNTNPELIYENWKNDVDIVIDDGIGGGEYSTVVDCTNGEYEITRQGKGVLTV